MTMTVILIPIPQILFLTLNPILILDAAVPIITLDPSKNLVLRFKSTFAATSIPLMKIPSSVASKTRLTCSNTVCGRPILLNSTLSLNKSAFTLKLWMLLTTSLASQKCGLARTIVSSFKVPNALLTLFSSLFRLKNLAKIPWLMIKRRWLKTGWTDRSASWLARLLPKTLAISRAS